MLLYVDISTVSYQSTIYRNPFHLPMIKGLPKTWRDRRDSENGQSACPVIVWQMGQELNEKCETEFKKFFIMKMYVFLGQ